MNLENKQNSIWEKINTFFQTWETNDDGIQYALDVVYNKKYVVSNYVFKSCLRHILWIYKFLNDENFPYHYDSKQAKIAYAFWKIQIVPEKRTPYILAPYRAFMLSVIFGWRYKSNLQKLVTQEIMDTEGRKNGKSTFYAIMGKYVCSGFLGDGFPTIFISGAGEKSSGIIYKIIGDMIKVNNLLRPEFVKNNRDVIMHKCGGEIRKLPFEKSALEGQNASLVILTEFHLHPDNRMQESARTGINESRDTQLIVYDTTKGQNMTFPYYEQEKNFKNHLDNQINNPEVFGKADHIFLFCAELNEDLYFDWKNPENWKQANPNIGITLSLETLIRQFESLVNKMDILDFKVKKIGMWVNQATSYFEIDDILKSQQQNENIVKEYFNSQKYKNLQAIAGLDLSNNKDTTALCYSFEIPQEDNDPIWVFKHKGFIPQDSALEHERLDRTPYFEWKEKGFLNFTQGETVDYNEVVDQLKVDCSNFRIKILAFDNWQFRFIAPIIKRNVYFSDENMIATKQGVALTPAIKEFERKLKRKKVYILDNNEMLISHLLNLSMRPSKNANDNFYPEKVQYNSRIDGAMSLFTAVYHRCDINATKAAGDLIANLNISLN